MCPNRADEKFSLSSFVQQYAGKRLEFYEALLETLSLMDVAIVLFKVHSKKIIYCNEAYAQIYGYTPSEILNLSSMLDLIAPDSQLDIRQRFKERAEGLDSVRFVTHYALRKDKKKIFIECAVALVEGTGDLLLGVFRKASS